MKEKKYFQVCPHCKGEAFKYRRKPIKDEYMTVELVDHKGNPKSGDVIACQECGKAIGTDYFIPEFTGVIEENKKYVNGVPYIPNCQECWELTQNSLSTHND